MSENSVIQMYGTADTDASATIDIPDDGILLSVQMLMLQTGQAADGDYAIGQIAFGSVSQFVTNDARGVLAVCGSNAELAGTAANVIRGDVQSNIYFGEDGIKVFGGERIYLHMGGGGNMATFRCYALLVFNFKNFIQRRR